MSTPRPYVDHPTFHDRAAYIALLRAELPALPPAMLLTDGEYSDAKPPPTLSREENAHWFKVYNAARRRLHTMRRDSRRFLWAQRVTYMEDYLTRCNTALVGYVYRRRAKLRLSCDANEAFSAGLEGLMRAIRAFDVSRGYVFVTLAHRCIWREMLGASTDRAKRERRLPIQSIVDDRDIDVTASEGADETADWRAQLYAALKDNRAGLTQLQRLTIQRHLGLKRITLQEIADSAGCSKEYCRQQQQEAVKRLRAVLCPGDD